RTAARRHRVGHPHRGDGQRVRPAEDRVPGVLRADPRRTPLAGRQSLAGGGGAGLMQVVERRLAGLVLRGSAVDAEAAMSRLRRAGLVAAVILALFIPQVTNPSFSFKLAFGGAFALPMLSLVVLIRL